MAVKKSRFLMLLLLYGFVMMLVGFFLAVSVGVSDKSNGDNGAEVASDAAADAADQAQTAAGEAASTEGGDDDEADKKDPVRMSRLVLGAGPSEPPEALLAGQFVDTATAEALLQRLQAADYKATIVEAIDDNQQTWFLVVLADFETQAQLYQAQYRLQQQMDISTRRLPRSGLEARADAS